MWGNGAKASILLEKIAEQGRLASFNTEQINAE